MLDNKQTELPCGGVTSYVFDRTKEKEICPSPIELNFEDMDDAPLLSTFWMIMPFTLKVVWETVLRLITVLQYKTRTELINNNNLFVLLMT
ncbi:hypothetical protein AQUCO_04200065v1 [Aquilegia coerulea]|uniref:Uncharacterized protein n=1 Tax=Aquilegia coerulea TaxID=218851 RepID=A0A2G5C0C4_AQUCA|nr:hypothetical protein AQUCO_54900002v1 [Aquilegia coerulea]PIA33053.1 hypothetical protein AQUCO_04200065v1 [Aquilegia coerulea]